MKTKKYGVAIIGCGNIAGNYDKPADKNILTHAHAISMHKKTALIGVYDILYKKAIHFAQRWDTIAFHNMEDMLSKIKPAFIYVCVPTERHLEILENILDYSPQAVICEKPLGNDIEQARRIVAKYKEKRVPLVINYTRRFDPAVRCIKQDIKEGKYGTFINASCVYTKGIIHNGSHVINLLRYFFGEIKSFEVLDCKLDYKESDPTLDLFIRFKDNKKTHLIAADESCYSIFELDFLFSKARIRLDEFTSKMTRQDIKEYISFSMHKELKSGIKSATGLRYALLNLIDNVIGHIEKNEILFSDAVQALQTQEDCLKFIAAYKLKRRFKR